MTGACIVRQLDREDADAWASLRREALETHPLAFGASIPDDPRFLVDLALARIAASDDSAIFGAFTMFSLSGTGGGMQAFQSSTSPWAVRSRLHLSHARLPRQFSSA